MAEDKIFKKGFLKKEGQNNKSIKNRFFVLTNTALNYYVDENSKLQGIVLLALIKKVNTVGFRQGKPFCFQIETPQRTYYLWAATEKDMNEWIESISNLVLPPASKTT
eukprot:TRINITY_DN1901_c0_g1_i1.p1 TRINITY_DN1901_c0_g1~~TRINITY_DN1901_c0_g1_i1.p1  ORF type:complete len:108 (-),score=29.98 TRINITY_DN1901_c0_g1_i1:146-469(-)